MGTEAREALPVMRGVVLMARGPAVPLADVPQHGIVRTEILGRRLAFPRGELLQIRVDLGPGADSGVHSHPGEEIAHVLAGTLEYELEAGRTVRVHAGESLFIAAGMRHRARNVGGGPASHLSTYLVKLGRPLVVMHPEPGGGGEQQVS